MLLLLTAFCLWSALFTLIALALPLWTCYDDSCWRRAMERSCGRRDSEMPTPIPHHLTYPEHYPYTDAQRMFSVN